MGIALISHLHGSLVALRAVLARIEHERVDRIVCLGDVATLGPAPGPVIDGARATRLSHDEFLLDPALIHSHTEAPVIVAAVDACRASLSTRPDGRAANCGG